MANVVLISISDELSFGLRYIAAHLRKFGYHPSIVAFKVAFDYLRPLEDEIIHPEFHTGLLANEKDISLLTNLVRELRADVVGLTVSSTYCDTAALLTARLKQDGGYPVVWGGADVLFNPDDALKHADVICMGEGEQAMLEVVDALTRGGSLQDIKGIWFRAEDGSIVRNERRPRIKDLDTLTIPLWDLSDTYYISEDRVWHGEYHPFGIIRPDLRYVVTSRGCPFRCTFCCNNSAGRKVYYGGPVCRRSVDNVLTEIRQIREQVRTITHISFCDEIFTVGNDWLSEFAERWPREIGLPFTCLSHPNAILPDMMRTLAAAGLHKITIGVQTGSERINKEIYGRRTARSRIQEAARIMAENNVLYSVDLIHENPYEEDEDYRETARMLNEFARPFDIGPVSPLQFWSNYDITTMALRDGMDLVQVNSHTYMSRKKPEYDFWRHLYCLASVCQMDPGALEFIMDARRLPGGDKFLQRISSQLWSTTYRARHNFERVKKDDVIEQLEAELARLEGSRMVRYYFGLKDRLSRFVGSKDEVPLRQ